MSPRLAQMLAAEQLNFGSDCVERRTCWVDMRLELLDALADWPGLHSILHMDLTRKVNGRLAQQTRYYLGSLGATATEFNDYIRQYWHIENRLHGRRCWWCSARASGRCQNGLLNIAAARKISLQALGPMGRQTQSKKSPQNG